MNDKRYNLVSRIGSHLITHNGLFDSGERLERRQEAVDMLCPADKRCERAKLLCQGQQNLKCVLIMFTPRAHLMQWTYSLHSQITYLILIVDGVGEEGDEL